MNLRRFVLTPRKLIYASDIIYVFTSFLARAAVVIFLKRLATTKRHQRFLNTIVYVCVSACVASILVIAVRENTSAPWDSSPLGGQNVACCFISNFSARTHTDIEQFYRWIVIEVLGMLLDVAIFAFPCVLVYHLQMSRGIKARIILGFASRLPLILIAITRLISLSTSLRSPAYSFDAVASEIITQTEMCYAVVSTTVPCLRVFMHAFNTGRLSATVMDTDTGSRTQRSYAVKHSNGSTHNASKATRPGEENGLTRHSIGTRNREHQDWNGSVSYGGEDGMEMSVMVVGGSRPSSDSDSSSRGIIKVKRRVDMTEKIMA